MKKQKSNKNYTSQHTSLITQKGITLVALVITIIILLILAGVGINMAISSEGLFAKANEAANKWNAAVEEESSTINDLLAKIETNTTKKVTIENVNLYNKEDMKIGYYVQNNSQGANENYMSTGYIKVEPGDEIYWCAYLPAYERFDYELTSQYYLLQSATYISTYDADKNFVNTETANKITFDYSNDNEPAGWIVPEGISYIRLCLMADNGRSDLADNIFVCKNEPPKYYADYGQTEAVINYNIYLPSSIQISEGTNFNIYNTNICPALYREELTFKWECEIGTISDNGITFNPTTENKGNYEAKVKVYDKTNNLLNSAVINIEVVSSTINQNKNILLIGDSLSNGKSWINQVEELSEDKISLTASAVSGASAFGYYTSANLASATSNPFYNSELGNFDYEYYLQNNNASYDSVMLFLGTNDMTMNNLKYPTINSENIKLKAIVDNIKEYDEDLPIYIMTPMTKANDYSRTTTAMNFVKEFYSTFSAYENVTIIPIELTVDPINDFGEADKIHPLETGYKKIADAVYSALCANQ